jgi:glutathione synthase/RimK-type ligase-like ATP-grasp enzyme
VVIVTSERLPSHWHDDESALVRAELARRGVNAVMRPWHDDTTDWLAEPFILVRSPWDLYWHLDEFAAWLDRVGRHPAVANPVSVMRWTLDKRYLRELASAGVAVVPTTVVEPGEDLRAFEAPIVVKPTTSGGAQDTARWVPEDLEGARAHVASLHVRGLGALVQPYMTTIDEQGERALIYIDGVFSHAIAKDAILRDTSGVDNARAPHPRVRLHETTSEERALADAALALVPDDHGVPDRSGLLFARVDMIPTSQGPRLLELELLDARLFLDLAPGAAGALADAIVKRMSG